jgi:hypothetical protein
MVYKSILRPTLLSRRILTQHNAILCRSLTIPQSTSTTEADLRTTLTNRQLPPIYDYLTPTPAFKLTNSLASFVPPSFIPYIDALASPHTLNNTPLPPAFHLIYFNPALPESWLLPDGTDPQQSPGQPYERRMWAGGALRFGEGGADELLLDGTRYVCRERISDVRRKGEGDAEKIFVTIERRIGRVDEGAVGGNGGASVVEERNIVFLRARSDEELAKAKAEMKDAEIRGRSKISQKKRKLNSKMMLRNSSVHEQLYFCRC